MTIPPYPLCWPDGMARTPPLGVSANASVEEIRAAHRALAAKHHPDKDPAGASLMAEINAARDAGLKAAASRSS